MNGNRKGPQKCSCDWQQADNAYHYFDDETTETVNWRHLVLYAEKEKPLQ
mgnify:CR=1 FL=1